MSWLSGNTLTDSVNVNYEISWHPNRIEISALSAARTSVNEIHFPSLVSELLMDQVVASMMYQLDVLRVEGYLCIVNVLFREEGIAVMSYAVVRICNWFAAILADDFTVVVCSFKLYRSCKLLPVTG